MTRKASPTPIYPVGPGRASRWGPGKTGPCWQKRHLPARGMAFQKGKDSIGSWLMSLGKT